MRVLSVVSTSGLAASSLCAACRREAAAAAAVAAGAARPTVLPSRSPASRAAAPAAQRTIRTAASPRPLTAHWTRTRASQSRSSSTDAAAPASSVPPSSSPSTTSPSSSPSSGIPAYYALFPETLPDGPPPRGKFAIDVRALRREFLRLQAASHPDFHHSAAASSASPPQGEEATGSSNGKSPARIRAEATSALINAAYKTLSSPLLRAQYLLREQHGVDLEADETTGDRAAGLPDAELLMTVLEAREAIEEAAREEDLEPLREANEARIRDAEARVGHALERGDAPAAVREAVRLRYWVNIREGIDSWERGKPVVLQH